MTKLFIPILLGTARKERYSEKVAKYVLKEAKEYGQFDVGLVDVRDFVGIGKTQGMLAEKSKKWSKIMKKADGLIIVSPEYNHGYPGELKLMLDELYKEYNRKPLAICGVSSGGLGGARMAEVLRIIAVELKMVPIRNTVYFSWVETIFNSDGSMKSSSKDPAYKKDFKERLKAMFDELVWYAKALKSARENENT